MTKPEILHLLAQQGPELDPQLCETHISWVLLIGDCAYKIKKPVQLPFLDTMILKNRKNLCMRELAVNKRLAPDLYQEVIPIVQHGEEFWLGGTRGEIVEYAVKMKRMDPAHQFNVMLENKQVTAEMARQLGQDLAQMHRSAPISYRPVNMGKYIEAFSGISKTLRQVQEQLGVDYAEIIAQSIKTAEEFLVSKADLFHQRLLAGYFRHLHGDLHSKNIFYYERPVFFDAMEFNEDWRRLDVLDEVATLCVDLEFYASKNLEDAILRTYLQIFPSMKNEDKELFLYYKLYRANVRAKVAIIAATEQDCIKDWTVAQRYLELMDEYRRELCEEMLHLSA